METAIDEPPSWLFGQLLIILGELDNSSLVFLLGTGGIILLLLAVSAIISGSEVAFFSMTNSELEQCQSQAKASDKLILALLNSPNELLATILIVNNFVNVAIITISTYATWRIAGTNEQGPILAAMAVLITVLIVFFGEIIPKIYANQKSLSIARLASRFLFISMKLVKPLSWMLVSTTSIVQKRIKKKGYMGSLEHVNHALELSTKGTTEQEKDILKGIVHFSTIPVTQIMRSRVDIEAIELSVSFHELMDKINKSGFSRIPVFKEDLDTVEGVLYVKDLLPYITEDEFFEWQKLLRPAYFVPEAKMIDTLLKDFQEKHVHMAIVVDEYGGTEGLITLEDIIEEIVGEIKDEYDEEGDFYKQIDAVTFDFEGKTSINDFCKIIKEDARVFDEIRGESESLGGMILEEHSKLPNTGEQVKFDKYTFTVLSVDSKRIKKVRVTTKKNK